MNQTRNIIAGLELGERVSQICYYDREAEEPLSIPAIPGEEQWEFPTALTKEHGTGEWLIGFPAVRAAQEGRGTAVGSGTGGGSCASLYRLLAEGKAVRIEGETCTAAELAAVYLRECLKLIGLPDPLHSVSGLGVTLSETPPALVLTLRDALKLLGFAQDSFSVQNYLESFYYYGYSQRPEVSARGMGLVRFEEGRASFLSMTENRMRKPFTVTAEEKGSVELPGEAVAMDTALQRAAAAWLGEKSLSSVFITGEGFSPDRARGFIRELSSRGCRVFEGNNLFVKGACWSVYERKERHSFRGRVFRGPDQMKASVGVDLIEGNAQKFCPLLRAGANWYEAMAEVELLPDGRKDILFTVLPEDGGPHRNEKLILEGLPERPDRATRLLVRMNCTAPDRCRISVEDLGFGEFYPATHRIWSREIDL